MVSTRCRCSALRRLISESALRLSPKRVLQSHCRWRRDHPRLLACCLIRAEGDDDLDLTVRIVAISFPIASDQRGTNAGHLVYRFRHSGSAEVVNQRVSFFIDVRRDPMRNLPCVAAQFDSSVEGGRSEPNWPPLGTTVQDPPEAHMVALIGARSMLLFKRKVLPPAFVEQRTDGSSFVWSMEQNAASNLKGGP